MHTKWVFKHFRHRPRKRILLLGTLWLVGLLSGILLCALGPYDSISILGRAVDRAPTAFNLLLTCVLPVGTAIIAISSPLSCLAYPTVALNAVSRGFCGTAIYIAQGSAAWLLRPMLLFSSCCSSVLFWWLILQNEEKGCSYKNIRLAGILSCLVFIVDLFLVLPVVGDLSKYF